jgi:hypothetical protein
MRFLAGWFVFAVVCLTLVAGCGGQSATRYNGSATPRQASSPASPADAASASAAAAPAASMLMTRDDFPRDYLERKSVRDAASRAIDACESESERGKTGGAATDDWLFDGQSPAISETVTVFATEADATARIGSARAMIECIVRAINDGKANETGIELSGATTAPVSMEAGGNNAIAFRIQAAQAFAGQTAGGTAQYTLALVSKGRVVCEILVRGSGIPFDPGELSDFVQSAAARIKQP